MSTEVLDVTPDSIEGRVKWRQNIQVRPYEVAECTIEREFRIPPDADFETEQALTQDAIFRVKTYVEDALGIKDREASVVELVKHEIPGAQSVNEHPVTAPPSGHVTPNAVGALPPHEPEPLAKPRAQMTDLEKAKAKENEAWASARLMTNPEEFYDNRESKLQSGNTRLPDFRHKTYKIGVWADRK